MFLSRRTIYGLSVYTRQVAHSVDRSLREDAQLLRDYLAKPPGLDAVLRGLDSLGMDAPTGPTSAEQADALHRSGPNRLSGQLQWWSRRGVEISDGQCQLVAGSLRDLSRLLQTRDVVSAEFVPPRYGLTMASDAFAKYVPRKLRGRINRIEHRNHALHIEHESFEEIVGAEPWLVPAARA